MKEIKTILKHITANENRGQQMALATVVNVYGSSYRRPGAHMLILENGNWFGSVSGGCLEGDVISKAREVMQNNRPKLYRYDTRQNAKNAFGMGYGCNGMLEILIEPVSASSKNTPFSMMQTLTQHDQDQGLATVFYSDHPEVIPGERMHSTGKHNILSDALQSLVREDLNKAIESSSPGAKTYRLEGNKVKVFHEVFNPTLNILIYGAVFHVIPFLRLADELGYNTHVTDSFEPIQPIWNFPHATDIDILEPDKVTQIINTTPNLAVVFLTHNFFYIKEELPKVLRSGASYVGILGSRKKTTKILREANITQDNFSVAELAKLHYPVGLDIGASTPEEIALSIIAEIKASFSGKSGESLKKFDGFIHANHTLLD